MHIFFVYLYLMTRRTNKFNRNNKFDNIFIIGVCNACDKPTPNVFG